METLNKNEYKMIRTYKKLKDENIALYFFNKFRNDLLDIIYHKVNSKFISLPYEKADFVHLIWKAVKITLENYKKEQNFQAILVRNCYLTTIREIKKFVNNGELIMNVSGSFDKYVDRHWLHNNKSTISNANLPMDMALSNLIEDACRYVSTYSQPTIKRVIYLKSIGYSITEICRKLRLSRHHIENLLKSIYKMVKKYY